MDEHTLVAAERDIIYSQAGLLRDKQRSMRTSLRDGGIYDGVEVRRGASEELATAGYGFARESSRIRPLRV